MKYLIVTGASGNLGRELINYLDLIKYDSVYLIGNDEILKSLSLGARKVSILSGLDLTVSNDVQKIFDQVEENKEAELFIIHLVGKYEGGKFLWEYDDKDFIKLLNTNFISAYLITTFALRKIQKMKGGSIVFISSRITLEYEPKRSVYALSKQLLNFFVKVIEKEGKELNFTANVIAPSIILTETNKKWVNEKEFAHYITPEQLTNLINSIFENYDRLSGNIFKVNDKI